MLPYVLVVCLYIQYNSNVCTVCMCDSGAVKKQFFKFVCFIFLMEVFRLHV